ncbi:MFS transporter [Mechercharimyces sp. CAU 1602]|uniref:MFS transporter n=1 Tax=Mechercharimyces sp. CAU 1602 TaxID=2973933 RepID=UPI002161F064|nr:MFS transporter [Mechercharimyces sp. CAU 1602]MCS1352727.1 MFS transporter [Mechercharimyces sp. CAU 1602]
MRFKDFHPNVKLRIFIMFISATLSSMILPFMAIYLANYYGDKVAGTLLLISVIVSIIFGFIGGYFSDRFGRRKMLIFAESLKFTAIIMMLLCNSAWFVSPSATYIAMILYKINGSFAGPAHSGMLIDVSTSEQRPLIYTYIYWAFNVGVAIGGIGGGLFFQNYLFEMLSVLAFFSFVNVALTIFFITETHFPRLNTKGIEHFGSLIHTYKEIFKDKLFIIFILAGTFILSMEIHLTNFTAIRLDEEFITQTFLQWEINGINMLGFLRAENTILAVIFSLFAIFIINRLRKRSSLIIGASIYVLAFGLIAYTNNLWLLIALMVIATLGEVIYIPIKQSLIAEMPSAHNRSSYMSINDLSFDIAHIIASLTIIISAYLSNLIVVFIIIGVGMVGVAIYSIIYKDISARAERNQTTRSKESA